MTFKVSGAVTIVSREWLSCNTNLQEKDIEEQKVNLTVE